MELEGYVSSKVEKPGVSLINLPLDLYGEPPNIGVTLQEIEDLFRQRLEMLHIFDADVDYLDEGTAVSAKDRIGNRLQTVPSSYYKTNFLRMDSFECRKYDKISHFLVRIYCARDTELWTWFVSAERRFLQYRMCKAPMSELDIPSLSSMLDAVNIEHESVEISKIFELIDKNYIYWARFGVSNYKNSPERLRLFKVPFEHAISLVQKRSVALMDGWALLTSDDLASVLCSEFQSALESTYDWSSIISTQSEETSRLMSILNMVYQDFKERVLDMKRRKKLENCDATNANAIDLTNIDDVAKRHFPPCMRHMLESLRKNHHLRHQARIYFGTFLRSGGVELDDAVDFFRKEFTHKIPVDKFERDYKYNIRHLYGKEGHRKALSCFSCAKIINENPPGPADNHACPFRHYDEANLRTMLRNHDISDGYASRIVNLAQAKNYQSACTEYFNIRHGTLPRAPIMNPIQFYNDSMDPPAVTIVAVEPSGEINMEAVDGDSLVAPPAIEPAAQSKTTEINGEFEFDD